MQDQISSVCRAPILKLRRLASIRSDLSERTSARLVFDYLPLWLLQLCLGRFACGTNRSTARVQNNAAQLVLKKRKRDHVTPLLNELYWPPVKFRCEYKIATFAFRHFDSALPSYPLAYLCTYQTSRILQSSSEKLLWIPKRNLKSVGDRSFSFIAPTVWKSLPLSLRNLPTLPDLKAYLKTFLFQQAFPQI